LICIVIPHFDHLDQFSQILPVLAKQSLPIVIVDDASPGATYESLVGLLNEHAPDAVLIRHKKNQGKGGAVVTGLKTALAEGYTHAIQIDADGQHAIADISRFIETARLNPESIICGQPVFDESVSSLRYYARYITLALSWLESLSLQIRDALCGFRLYPLKSVVPLIEESRPGTRMAFDPEILVRAVWADIPLRFIPVEVKYPTDGKSHFQYVADNIEISWMHARLLCGVIIRLPRLLMQNYRRAGTLAS
jgi:glycosyltransferase involved in cell wall biosynthesis